METIALNNGVRMPVVGMGVFRMTGDEVREALPAALAMGYRLIDTAALYGNEDAVGEVIAASGLPRDELFVTTKVWYRDYGRNETLRAFERSLGKLGLDHVDLYLLHQPFNDYYGAWRTLEELHGQGLIRAIGVSNFMPDRYVDLVVHNDITPAVNQCEVHPLYQRQDLQEIIQRHGTVLQAWAPLAQGRSEVHDSPLLRGIAERHGRSVAQVMLRWLVQRGIPLVVKSTHEARLRENLDVFSFELTEQEMSSIAALDKQTPNAGMNHHDPRLLEYLHDKYR
jgi:2,5-didehydrogluconate reductase